MTNERETELETRSCVECGATFRMTEREVGFYVERGLQLPRRCSVCRQARRERDRRAGLDQRVTR